MPSIIPIPALADNCVRLLVQAAVAALGDPRAAEDTASFAVARE